MWFLMVEKLCPLKDESLKESEEALDPRTRSYKSAPKLIERENLLKIRSYRSNLKLGKEVN